MHAFDVEIQTMLVRLRNLPPHATLDVYMTPARTLYSRQHLGAKIVGTYGRKVSRADFWEDCHWLAERNGWSVKPEIPADSRACAFDPQVTP